ncbi:hypothetical protein EJB05_13729, partial [Eragrostis curvula]
MSSSSSPSSLLRPLHCNLQELQAAASMYPLAMMTATMAAPAVSTQSTVTMSSPASVIPAVDKGLLDDMVPPAMRHAL